jgi:hypothetical protein
VRRAFLALALVACRADTVAPPQKAVDPPVSSPDAIPDAPVTGTVRGAPFVARDMRYIVDDRVGYAHTDIKLSVGKADVACGAISTNVTSVWLRRESADKLGADGGAAWSVHYQVFERGKWIGLVAKSALVSIRGVSADGRLSGGLAVCFGDESNSCVSGSFEAVSCPPNVDQPVRGTPPPESIPRQYLERLLTDAGVHD